MSTSPGYTQPTSPWCVPQTPASAASTVSDPEPTVSSDEAADLVFQAIVNRAGRSVYPRRGDTPLWSAMAAACPTPSVDAEERIRALEGEDLKQILQAVQAVHREAYVNTREYFDAEALYAPLMRSTLACPADDLSARLALELLLHFHRQVDRQEHREVRVLDEPDEGGYLQPSAGEFMWFGIEDATRVQSVIYLITWAADLGVSEGGYDLLYYLGHRFMERNSLLDRDRAARRDKIDSGPPPF